MKFVAAVLARHGAFKGLWHYLTVRTELHAALEKERERNRAFARYLDRLPDHAGLMDYEDRDGRKLWIRKCDSGCSELATAHSPSVFAQPEYIEPDRMRIGKNSRRARELGS